MSGPLISIFKASRFGVRELLGREVLTKFKATGAAINTSKANFNETCFDSQLESLFKKFNPSGGHKFQAKLGNNPDVIGQKWLWNDFGSLCGLSRKDIVDHSHDRP